MESPDFWLNRENAQKFSEELSHLKQELDNIENIKKEINDLESLSASTEGGSEFNSDFQKEIYNAINALEKQISNEETKTFFSGLYDKNNVIITVYSGAGGLDAQDWANMLLRMYERYADSKGYKVTLLSKHFGEEKGIKEATLEIGGRYAYGYLKKENGVHRLVRISPFSAQSLRHTSFALVEVLPQIESDSEKEAEIKPDDLEIQTFRASGPGGQYVNKTESAVRVKHLPSGIVVECQSERLQGENKARALKLLKSKLFAKRLREQREKVEQIKGGFISAEWGSQIRSYVLHPYKMVKDHRTGVETSNAEAVLNGDLDEFIEAEVRLY